MCSSKEFIYCYMHIDEKKLFIDFVYNEFVMQLSRPKTQHNILFLHQACQNWIS